MLAHESSPVIGSSRDGLRGQKAAVLRLRGISPFHSILFQDAEVNGGSKVFKLGHSHYQTDTHRAGQLSCRDACFLAPWASEL